LEGRGRISGGGFITCANVGTERWGAQRGNLGGEKGATRRKEDNGPARREKKAWAQQKVKIPPVKNEKSEKKRTGHMRQIG